MVQHDSSEFLSWLIDAFHEDLNRVLKKPNTENIDSNGREDIIVA
jgi:ubiquitin C-terminal hydrolase